VTKHKTVPLAFTANFQHFGSTFMASSESPITKPVSPLLDHEQDEHVHGPDCQHDHEHHHHAPQMPFQRATPKLGRNDPCYCGSGKKFKKCHGAVE
jgi:preprotein translocase subunit SecA